MKKKKSKPVTPARRFYRGRDFSEVTKKKAEKSLVKYLPSKGGRNSSGRMTVPHRGGGVKRKYRKIDFKRDKHSVEGKVRGIEYDPNRSARIALVVYKDGEKRYIIAPRDLSVGDTVQSGENAPISTGNHLPLGKIPLGTFVHNIELEPGRGGIIARAAGNAGQILAKEGNFVHVRMPSGEIRLIREKCFASVGRVGNVSHDVEMDGKAGRSRWKGKRPRVRGVAKNPVDHPLGGGEGRTAGGRHPTSKTGVLSKGYKTRKPKKQSSKYIIKRRKVKRRK